MDDSQTAFAAQYQAYGFDLDMMKVSNDPPPFASLTTETIFNEHFVSNHAQRPMDTVGGPDAKKARWSPTSFAAATATNGTGSAPTRDAFANYGYGPQANLSPSGGFANSSPNGANHQLYSTPSLTLNTTNLGNANGGMPSQLSPNTAGPYTPQQQAPQQSANGNGNMPFGAYGAYGMLGMGIPGMLNGFQYNAAAAAANFGQVSSCLFSRLFTPEFYLYCFRSFFGGIRY